MPGQMPRNRTLSRASRAVDGNNDLAGSLNGAQRGFFRTHPRFFVPCLGGAVKPNRLEFPAFVPAVSAGLRLLRAGRASGRASFRAALPLRVPLPLLGWLLLREVVVALPAALAPLEWPLRWPHAGADGFLARAPAVPFAGRDWLPFARAPLVKPFPV